MAQRWVIVSSEARSKRRLARLRKELDREGARAQKELRKLKRRRFNCEADARQEMVRFAERLRFHGLEGVGVIVEAYHAHRGRPSKGQQPHYRYQISAELAR